MYIKLIVLSVMLFGLAISGSSQIKNIELVPGKAATFSGQIARGGEARYIFTAKSGSALWAKVSSTNKTVKFKVCEQYRVDEEIIEEKQTETTVTLPETENGLYSVVVTATGAARFTLELKTSDGEIYDQPVSNDPWDVDEFFLQMPKKVDGSTVEEREEILGYTSDTIMDDDKQHIVYQTMAAGEIFEAVVLDTADRDRIFVYNEDHDPTDVTRTKLVVLRCSDGKFTDITAQVLPVAVNTAYKYDLPSTGKTITVRDKNKKVVYRLTWNGTKFLQK